MASTLSLPEAGLTMVQVPAVSIPVSFILFSNMMLCRRSSPSSTTLTGQLDGPASEARAGYTRRGPDFLFRHQHIAMFSVSLPRRTSTNSYCAMHRSYLPAFIEKALVYHIQLICIGNKENRYSTTSGVLPHHGYRAASSGMRVHSASMRSMEISDLVGTISEGERCGQKD